MNPRSKEEYYARKALREREAEKRASESWKTKLKEPVTLFTGILALLALLQFLALNSTDRATHDLAKAAVEQASIMAADQRPWVKVQTVEPFVHPLDANIGGLNYAGSHNVGFLPLHFVLKNAGRAPAFDLRLGIGEVFGYAQKVEDLAKVEQDKCAALDTAYPPMPMLVDDSSFIRVIFPNDTAPYDGAALAITADQISKYSTGDENEKQFQLFFYGCIRYKFANTKSPHQTSFAYRVSRLVDAAIPGGKAASGFTPWENVPADRILIEPRPMAAGITD
jgi:hypothetical protein